MLKVSDSNNCTGGVDVGELNVHQRIKQLRNEVEIARNHLLQRSEEGKVDLAADDIARMYELINLQSDEIKHLERVMKEFVQHDIEQQSAKAPNSSVDQTAHIYLRKQLEAVQNFMAISSSRAGSPSFLNQLVEYLAEKLQIDNVSICRLEPNGKQAHVVASYGLGNQNAGDIFDLDGTPYHDIILHGACCYTNGVSDIYPGDSLLARLHAEAYAGAAIWGHKGKPIGFVSVANIKPADNIQMISDALQFAAIRVAGEIERLEADYALQQSEAKFRTFVEKANDIIFTFDANGLLTYVSPNWTEQIGYDAADVIGQPVSKYIHPDDLDNSYRFMTAMLTNPSASTSFEFRTRNKKGDWLWYSTNGTLLADEKGTMTSYLGIARNITDIVSSSMLQEMNAKLMQVLTEPCSYRDTVYKLIPYLKQTANVEAVSIRLQDGDEFPYYIQYGFRNTESNPSIGLDSHSGQYHCTEQTPHQDCICAKIINGDFDPLDPRFTPHGSFFSNDLYNDLNSLGAYTDMGLHQYACLNDRYTSMAIVPIYGDDKVVGLIQLCDRQPGQISSKSVNFLEAIGAHIGSVLTRKHAEEALRASNSRFMSYFNLPLHGITITSSTDYHWVEVNDQACTILKHSREELTKLSWVDMTYPDDLEADFLQFRKLVSGEIENYKIDKRFIAGDGSIVWTTISVGCVRNAQDTPDYIVCVMEDITERKKVEEEKAALQNQFIQAQKMETIGRLAGGVAHDFNNMLGVIMGNIQLALEAPDNGSTVIENLSEALKAAEKSANLTRQLLAFARKQTITPKVINLSEVIVTTLSMLQRLIGEGIDLIWSPKADLWSVLVDSSQVDQILVNLCVNSRDAIADVGYISITADNVVITQPMCSLLAGAVPGEYVKLTVTDNGCGMDEDALTKIFDPFYTTKNMGAGTGLGLSTVYGAVHQNNGLIYAESKVGEGTTMTIYLPRCLDENHSPTVGQSRNNPMHGHETILLVEDERSILKMTTTMLQRLGYSVLATDSPTEAVRLAQEHSDEISLVLTDVVMPEMSGGDLADKLRQACTQLRFLYMSGYTADVITHDGKLSDDVHFIQKPFTLRDLSQSVRTVIDGKD